MITLDGSYGEGGGQIVRTALALSTLTGKSFEVTNIRKGRCSSGLKAQHLYCIKALKELCDAKTNDVDIGSEELRFIPGKIKSKNLKIDIGTAGSITLLLQSLVLPCSFANKKIKLNIKGGTDGKWAMPFDYFNDVFIPHLRKIVDINVKLLKRGFYPKGGGEIEIIINPEYKLNDYKNFNEFLHKIKGGKKNRIDLIEQQKLLQIKGVSYASKELENANVVERQAKSAEVVLSKLNSIVNIRNEYCSSLSVGTGVVLWGVFGNEEVDFDNPVILGADALGERGKKAEVVGQEAAKNLIKEIDSRAAVDSHLEDNLIPYMALFGGKIKVSELTNHTKTNIYVVEKFLDVKFEIDEKEKIISV